MTKNNKMYSSIVLQVKAGIAELEKNIPKLFTQWEADFIADINLKMEVGMSLSDKQLATAIKMLRKNEQAVL